MKIERPVTVEQATPKLTSTKVSAPSKKEAQVAASQGAQGAQGAAGPPREVPLFPAGNAPAKANQHSTQGALHAQLAHFETHFDRHSETKTHALLRTTLEPARFASSVPETQSIVARRLDLVGTFHPAKAERGASSTSLQLSPAADAGVVYGGERYIELPNSTSLSTTDPRTGRAREFVLTRGVRPYSNEIDEATHQFNAPRGYVSDVLLFERNASGVLEYLDTVLRSAPEQSFAFEDPRISAFIDERGARRILLSGTDYAPHAPGAVNPDVMNRYVELKLDDTGKPKPVDVHAVTKRPAFKDLSPAPRKTGEGFAFLDAKNAVVAANDDGQLVVRTRFRPSANDPAFAGSGVKPWGYGEQVFVFASFEQMQSYDWSHALADLLGTGGSDERVRPLVSKRVAVDDTMHELYPAASLAPGKGKGFGPGTAPVRVRRAGDDVFLSEGKGAPEVKIGTVRSGSALEGFPIKDGGVAHLTFDHEVRYCVDKRADVEAVKRVYSASIKLWDKSLTSIDKVFADAVQPLLPHQRGGSGILDLHHTYPMGRVIVDGLVRVSSGECDAHTASYDFDVMALLLEMADGGAREASGQVYRPSRV